MGISKLQSQSSGGNNALLQYLSWAGSSFPYNVGASDITIATNTTWSDSIGFKRVKKLTINAGITLTINKSPFYIFADEINFGSTTSGIDATGAGALGMVGYIYGKGGSGGGLLIVVANTISGSTGFIKANGGNAFWTSSGSSYSGYGKGAFGGVNPNGVYGYLLANGGDNLENANYIFSGGGSGGSDGSVLLYNGQPSGWSGGSGIGGGGGWAYNQNGSSLQTGGSPSTSFLSPSTLLLLAQAGCLGGGGGGGLFSSSNASLAGGGGGGVGLFVKNLLATPTLSANGGQGYYNSTTLSGISGGAGYVVTVTL